MSTSPSPFADPASPILENEPSISDSQRADLHDAFYSKSPDELIQHLAPLAIPDDLKNKLHQAKQATMPVAGPIDKVTAAVQRIAQLDPQTRQIAESSPNLLKAFTAAATTEAKAPAEPAGASSPAGKGKTAPAAEKPALSPRQDGQPHFPPIPDSHHRVLSSNGGVYDIPAENVEAARAADPNMHILNP